MEYRYPFDRMISLSLDKYTELELLFSGAECYHGKIKGLPDFLPEVLLILSLDAERL